MLSRHHRAIENETETFGKIRTRNNVNYEFVMISLLRNRENISVVSDNKGLTSRKISEEFANIERKITMYETICLKICVKLKYQF